MAIFSTRIRHVSFTLSPFSPEAMSNIAGVLLNTGMIPRIKSGVNAADSPAKALNPKYATDKFAGRRVSGSGGRKFRGLPIRNLTLRGWTLASAKVKVASENRATIGFITPQAAQIVSANQRIENMWDVSPADRKVLDGAVYDALFNVYGKGFVMVRRSA